MDLKTDIKDYPYATEVIKNVTIYDTEKLPLSHANPQERQNFLTELIRVFKDGPGILVVRNAIDKETLDAATDCFNKIMKEEKELGVATGDHFGTNSRVWNLLEKMAVDNPEVFVKYYQSEVIQAVSEAWLGVRYQVTAQLNVVHPGGIK